jgi:hypothetical protein
MFYFQRQAILRVKTVKTLNDPTSPLLRRDAFCVPVNSTRGETFDELKGLSLDVVWTQHGRFITPPETAWRTDTQKQALQAYISSKGNICDYETFTDGAGRNYKWHRITGLDKGTVYNTNKGLMYTWTMVDGHLTKIQQGLAGFRTITVSVDPRNLTCSFQARDQPDPKTGQFWVYRALDARATQIMGRTVASYVCNVKRGNIFGLEQ